MRKIKDVFTLGNGIFAQIASIVGQPFTWLSQSLASILDYEWFGNHSSEKYLSPLLNRLIDTDELGWKITTGTILMRKYTDKWNKLYEAYINSDYKPLENYSMVEDENVGSEIVTDMDSNQNTFGFNTDNENGVPQSVNGAKTTTSGDYTKNKRKLTRSGNIGVTTSQQMLQSEIDLRQYNFYEQLFNDVDEVMCLAFRRVR